MMPAKLVKTVEGDSMTQQEIIHYMTSQYPVWVSVGYIKKKFGRGIYPKIKGLVKTNMLERIHIKNKEGLTEQVVRYNDKFMRG